MTQNIVEKSDPKKIKSKSTGTFKNQRREIEIFSSGINIVEADELEIKVPVSILTICNMIQEEFKGLEFSILVKGQWRDDSFVLSEEYVIPRQEVGTASVDYLESLDPFIAEGFNTVIHSHPFQSSTFSKDDDETINCHFRCSLLYSKGKFTKALVSVQPSSDTKLLVDGKVVLFDRVREVTGLENIQKKTYNYNYNYNYNYGSKTYQRTRQSPYTYRRYLGYDWDYFYGEEFGDIVWDDEGEVYEVVAKDKEEDSLDSRRLECCILCEVDEDGILRQISSN